MCYTGLMGEWSFLTNHAQVLVCIADDPEVRLRDIASTLDITERSVFGIVTDLTKAGYVTKEKDGRRNRYQVQGQLPLLGAVGRERSIGEVLGILVDSGTLGRGRPVRDAPSSKPGKKSAANGELGSEQLSSPDSGTWPPSALRGVLAKE